ncbi:nSTAND1 domain-containing NTPase [Williamsia sp. M5A3_1d]
MRPDDVHTREELGRALSEIRSAAGLSIRETAARAGGLTPTVGGWFSGQHAPTAQNEPTLRKVLAACGVESPEDQAPWIAAAERARRPGGRRTATTPTPYRGFSAFGVEDHEWFFGRDDITDLLIGTVLEQADHPTATMPGADRMPLVTLIGPSGAGKSSVLRAGLLAQMENESGFEAWRHTLMTPGGDPIGSLEAALAELPSGDGPVLLAIDQAEEVWTLSHAADRRDRFEARLIEFSTHCEVLVVVATVRADFYGVLASLPRFTRPLQNAHILVPALDERQVREVILEPARVAGLQVADDLVDLLLGDLRPGAAGIGAGSLPLLSHALLSTWARSDKRTLTVGDYLATGRISGAVEQTAERVYAELDYAEKGVARRQLLAMAHVDDESASRRRAPLAELGFPPNIDLAETSRDVRQRRAAGVLDRFAAARLVTVGDTYAEVTHEALLSAWPRLRQWISEDRENLLEHRRLQAVLAVWSDADEAPELLPFGGRLDLFNEFAQSPENGARISPDEQRFLDLANARSVRLQSVDRRRLRQLRTFAGAATVFAVVALLAAVLAVVARTDAVDQKETAETLRRDALSARLAVQSDQQRLIDPALSMQLAMVAYRISPTVEARSALMDNTATPVPVRYFTAEGPGKVTLSPGGTMLAAVGSDDRVRLYSTGTRGIERQVATFGAGGTDQPLFGAAFDADSRHLFVGGAGPLTEWDVSDPTAPRPTPGVPTVTGVIRDIAVNRTGDLLAVAVDGAGVKMFRRSVPSPPSTSVASIAGPRWQPVAMPPDVAGDGTFVRFSPDGRMLAAASGKNRVDVYSTTTPVVTTLASIPLQGASDVTARDGAFSPTGELAVAINSRDIRTYSMADPTRPTLTRDFAAFESFVNGVDYSADGRYLLGASADNTTRVFDLTGGSDTAVLRSGGVVSSAVFVGDHVVSASEDGTLKVWPPQRPSVQAGIANPFQQFAFDAQGTQFITANADDRGSLAQWSLAPGARVARRGPVLSPPPGQKFGSLGLSDDGRTAAVGSFDGRMYLGDYTDPARPRLAGPPVDPLVGPAETVDVSVRSNVAVVGGVMSNSLAIIDISDRAQPRRVGGADVGDGIGWAALTADGKRVVVTTVQGYVLLIDLQVPSRPQILFRQKVFNALALVARFSPDERRIVVASASKEAKVIDIGDARAPRVVSTLTGPSSTIYGTTFSRDGNRVAAGGADGKVWIWDVRTAGRPRIIAQLQAYPGRIYDVMFGPDDRSVVAIGARGLLQTWQVDPESIVAQTCASKTAPISRAEWSRFLPNETYRPTCT